MGSIPGSGRSPGEGNGNPLQYSCLENPMDGGAWRATVHRVTKSDTTEWLHFHFLSLVPRTKQQSPDRTMLMPFVHITNMRCSLESCSFYSGVSWSPLPSTCKNRLCVFFLVPQSAQQWLQTGHSRNIYATEIGKAASQGFFTPRLLVV